MSKKIHARTLLNYSADELFNTLYGRFTLVCDDGEILVTGKETVYSRYFWEFHVRYPNLPILTRHHVSSVLKGKMLNSDTHIKLLSVIGKDLAMIYQLKSPHERESVTKFIYQTTNVIYNELSQLCEPYVTSIDILDFIQIVDAPELKEVYENIKPTQQSIDLAYSSIMTHITKSDTLNNNSVARAVRCKLANANQVLQCVAPRGYVTDVDSVIFPNPIIRGFVQGIRSLHDSMIESRSAAKALYFSEDPLKQAEYFARRLQLLTMTLETIHYVDCGSTDYITWRVRPPVIERGKEIYSGDLTYMVGKYYLDEATNTLKVIAGNETHLYDKIIKMRSIVAGCNHPDPHGVCSVCFGELAHNHTHGGNIGNASGGTMTQQSTQAVLSTKHYDGNSEVDSIVIPAAGVPYIDATKDGSSYLIKDSVIKKGFKLVISSNEAKGLTDVLLVDSVYDMTIQRISEIEYIGFISPEGITTTIPVFIDNRYANLTHEFLAYAKVHRWELDQDDNYVFDLSYWDTKKAIMTLPSKQFNMSSHSSSIAEIIEARVKELTERSKTDSPAATLMELFDVVNTKLFVNISLLEAIIYAAMVVDVNNNNFMLPKKGDDRGLGVTSVTIPNRSLSAAIAYEGQYNTITDPRSFFEFERPSNVMDVFVMPRETFANIKK